jgi:hypothetical protein
MTDFVKVTLINKSDLPDHISEMDKATRDWTTQAARGECGWVCSDCCMSDAKGMPDECWHRIQRCTDIIQRDKRLAMTLGNEPS